MCVHFVVVVETLEAAAVCGAGFARVGAHRGRFTVNEEENRARTVGMGSLVHFISYSSF